LNYVKLISKPKEIKFDWFDLNSDIEKIEPLYLVWIEFSSLSYHYFGSSIVSYNVL